VACATVNATATNLLKFACVYQVGLDDGNLLQTRLPISCGSSKNELGPNP